MGWWHIPPAGVRWCNSGQENQPIPPKESPAPYRGNDFTAVTMTVERRGNGPFKACFMVWNVRPTIRGNDLTGISLGVRFAVWDHKTLVRFQHPGDLAAVNQHRVRSNGLQNG